MRARVVACLLLFLCSVWAVAYSPKEIRSPQASVPLYKSTFEGLYYANVEIGTPPQVCLFCLVLLFFF